MSDEVTQSLTISSFFTLDLRRVARVAVKDGGGCDRIKHLAVQSGFRCCNMLQSCYELATFQCVKKKEEMSCGLEVAMYNECAICLRGYQGGREQSSRTSSRRNSLN